MNGSGMRVSLLIPVYNVEAYLERCAVSLFEQTYPRIEFVFVDDCTQDRSMDVLRETMARYPDRAGDVRIVRHETNLGLAAARKTGVDAATGDYIMFVDSDDWLERDAVEKTLNVAEESGADMVACGFIQHFSRHDIRHVRSGAEDPAKYFDSVLAHDAWCTLWAILFKAGLLKDYPYQRLPGVSFAEDYLLLPQVLRHVSRIVRLDEPLYHYDCRNSDGCSRKIRGQMIDAVLGIRDLFRSMFPDARSQAALERGIPRKMLVLLKEFCVGFDPGDAETGTRIVREMAGMDLSGLALPDRFLFRLCRAGLFRTAGAYVRTVRGVKRTFDRMRSKGR